MMIYRMTLLLSVAWALLIFNENLVYSGVIVGEFARLTECLVRNILPFY